MSASKFRFTLQQLRDLWGQKFCDQVVQETMVMLGPEVSVEEIMAVAIGEFLNSSCLQPCKKCGSVRNVHCVEITRNEEAH